MAFKMWAWAAIIRLLKRFVPLETIVRVMQCAPSRRAPGFADRLERYMASTRRFPFRAPANCLERSLGAYRLLCEAAASPELVIAVRRSPGAGVQGHVWVSVGGRALAERDDFLADYVPVVTFDAEGHRHARTAEA